MNRKKIIMALSLALFMTFLLSACSGVKKCNGKRGIRTQMGPM